MAGETCPLCKGSGVKQEPPRCPRCHTRLGNRKVRYCINCTPKSRLVTAKSIYIAILRENGLTFREIAEKVDLSPGRVAQLHYRGARRLKPGGSRPHPNVADKAFAQIAKELAEEHEKAYGEPM